MDQDADYRLDDVEPLVIAVGHGQADRLLGDGLRKNDVLVLGSAGGDDFVLQESAVGGVRVTLAGHVGSDGRFERLEGDHVHVQLVLAVEVLEVQLACSPLSHAYRRTFQVVGAGDAQGGRHGESLAIVERGMDEVAAPRGVAAAAPGVHPGQDIEFSGCQRGTTLCC